MYFAADISVSVLQWGYLIRKSWIEDKSRRIGRHSRTAGKTWTTFHLLTQRLWMRPHLALSFMYCRYCTWSSVAAHRRQRSVSNINAFELTGRLLNKIQISLSNDDRALVFMYVVVRRSTCSVSGLWLFCASNEISRVIHILLMLHHSVSYQKFYV